MISVQIAMNGELVRDALAESLRQAGGIDVRAETADGDAGADFARRSRSDVVVLGEPPWGTHARWVAAYREAAPASKVVLLLIGSLAVDLDGDAGADAVVEAGDGLAELAAAIRRVVRAT